MCHGGMSRRGYHASVVERIEGHRLTRAWLAALRDGLEADDFES